VVRVTPEYLQKQEAAPEVLTEGHLEGAVRGHQRFERYLSRNGYTIRKFF